MTPFLIIILFGGALLVLIGAYYRLNKALHHARDFQRKFEKEKLFAQTILHSSPDSIIVLDNELRLVSANPNAEKVLNKITPDYIGKKVTTIFPETDSIADMLKALQGETIFRKDFYSVIYDKHYEIIYMPLKNNHEVIGLIAQSRDITGILKTNKQLEKQNEELEERNIFIETLYNASVDIILVVDNEMRYISANKKALEAYANFYPETIIGKKINEVLPHSPTDNVKAALKGETVVVKKFKSLVFENFYEISYIPLYKKNRVYAVMIITHDISENIKTEEEIRTLNQTYQYAEQIGMFGSYRYNFDIRKITYSDNLYRLIGCEPNEFAPGAENFMKFIHPDDVQYVLDATTEAFTHKHISKWEYRIIRKDGVTINVRGTGKIITGNEGGQWMLGTLQDITEEKNNERVLKESEEKFNTLFQFSPFSITLTEMASGKFIDVNENYLKTFGFSRDEVIGHTSLELGMLDEDVREKTLSTLDENGGIKNMELEMRKKSGEKIPVLVSIETITIGGKKYFLNASNDIIDRKKTEKKIQESNQLLQQMNRELESFAYISSHDLQEPLRKIQTFASRIIEKEYDTLSENAKEHFNRMKQAAYRMQTLIEDLLAYSRTTATDRKFEITDLSKILNEVKEDLKEELNDKQAIVETTQMCDANIIPFQFRQLMHNLIGNSLKFSNPLNPPHIKIKSEILTGEKTNIKKLIATQNYCHISVADNGIGFKPEYSEKIFDVFQRLHSKDKYEGTGIGLAIVKKIVENHNGIITAVGEVNKGATFHIYFPVL